MDHAVVKGGGHILIHCPSLVIYGHALQEEMKEGADKSLDLLLPHLRKYKEAVNYLPNQVYIGNLGPEVLGDHDQPWWDSSKNIIENSKRFGPYGEIIPQDEFFALMKIVDVFDLVWLEKSFTAKITKKLKKHPLLSTFDLQKLGEGKEEVEIKEEIEKNKVLALIDIDDNCNLIGCVRYAHKSDTNLSAQIISENIASKASASLALKYALKNIDYNSEKIEYIIECSEEAVGDAFQRGGGNLAKSIGEVVGCNKATGSDLRAFCAGPVYGVLTAASHVSAATFKEIAVVAGGSLPKLGMNYKKLLEKKIPILEDCLAAIAIIVGKDDGKNPIIRHEITGRHTIGRKTSPQEIMEALVSEPLAKLNKKITDIDKFAAELHNPEITVPAGAGDVARANYRMIAALAVKKNEIKREEIDEFVKQKGMIGFVPTQGHIPSGVPFISFARKKMLEDKIDTSLIIGKGSLFLGRMTNLFDGVSLLLERNKPKKIQEGEIVEDLDNEIKIKEAKKIKIAVSTFGYEHDIEEIISACEEILRYNEKTEPIIIGKENTPGRVKSIKISNDLEINSTLNTLIDSGEIDGALAMHYTFDMGVASVGKLISPSKGNVFYLATTTGNSATQRVEALIRNTIAGIAVAKTDGILEPRVGLLNLEGALVAKRALDELVANGYPIKWVASLREDKDILLRGNDLLSGEADVVIVDSLSGNILMKILSSYINGGKKEILGYGYGPGVGENTNRIINIISRASGRSVIVNALKFTAAMVKNKLFQVYKDELEKAYKYGLKQIIEKYSSFASTCTYSKQKDFKKLPPKVVLDKEIEGIDVMGIERAVTCLLDTYIYATSGMGCIGPVIMLNKKDKEKAIDILKKEGFLN